MPSSAGILLHRRGALEVLLVHPGGPFWAKKDAGAWSIPKGECEPGEDPRARALIEFAEETGTTLGRRRSCASSATVKQKGGKRVVAFAAEGDLDADAHRLQHVRDGVAAALRPPPGVPGGRPRRVVRRSTRRASGINPAQAALLDRLQETSSATSAP